MLKRKSEEEKDARRLEKEAEVQAKAERQELERHKQERKDFLASPAGQARTAFESEDQLFQFEIDVKNTKAVVIPMVTATNATSSTDPVAILNSVCNEGWELVNGSFVFHELGSESRDKFMASGQNVAVKGTVIGYYLFRRCEANQKQSAEIAIAALA